MPKPKTYQNIYIGLSARNHERLSALAKLDGKTKTEIAREALSFYLDHRETSEVLEKESAYAAAIKEMTNRICGMLARQGTTIGVLYELAWRTYSFNEATKDEFISVVNEVKSKQRKRLEADEKALTARMAKIVKGEVD